MPLTPEDVQNKRFSTVRFKEGYDEEEVDAFLDEVESELRRLLSENTDLRSRPGAAPAAAVPAAAAPVAAAAPAAPVATEEPNEAALRTLLLAQRTADEAISQAKQEAEQIVGAARTEAERLESETKARTEALEQEARARAQNLDAETEAKRSELLGDIEQEKARLDGEVDTLRAFEREYRSRLKSYFTEQLQALDGLGEGGEVADPGDSRRLRSVLGEPGDHESASGTPDPDATPGDQQVESPKA